MDIINLIFSCILFTESKKKDTNLGRWSMSTVLRSFEFERVAGQLEVGDFLHGDLKQPTERVGLDRYVSTARYRDAQRSLGVLESVALEDHAIALRHLEQRIRSTDVLEGLSICHQSVDARDVDTFQLSTACECSRLDTELTAVRNLDLHCVFRYHAFGQLYVLESEK